jgi:hypothetical protein
VYIYFESESLLPFSNSVEEAAEAKAMENSR